MEKISRVRNLTFPISICIFLCSLFLEIYDETISNGINRNRLELVDSIYDSASRSTLSLIIEELEFCEELINGTTELVRFDPSSVTLLEQQVSFGLRQDLVFDYAREPLDGWARNHSNVLYFDEEAARFLSNSSDSVPLVALNYFLIFNETSDEVSKDIVREVFDLPLLSVSSTATLRYLHSYFNSSINPFPSLTSFAYSNLTSDSVPQYQSTSYTVIYTFPTVNSTNFTANFTNGKSYIGADGLTLSIELPLESSRFFNRKSFFFVRFLPGYVPGDRTRPENFDLRNP